MQLRATEQSSYLLLFFLSVLTGNLEVCGRFSVTIWKITESLSAAVTFDEKRLTFSTLCGILPDTTTHGLYGIIRVGIPGWGIRLNIPAPGPSQGGELDNNRTTPPPPEVRY